MLFTFLLVVHAIIAAALVGVILMQRSEGGGLGMGGSPSGLMSARGAADFLTRATTVLAALFVAMCIGLATLASFNRTGGEIDTTLARPAGAPGPAAPGALPPLGNAAAPLPTTPPSTSDPLAAPATAPAPTPAARVERVTPTPPSSPPAAPRRVTEPAPAPADTTTPARIPGLIPAPSIPAGNASAPNSTGPGN